MCLFPSAPQTPPAPTQRKDLDTGTEAIDAREQERRRLSRRKGYEGTMLTGPGGQTAQAGAATKRLLGE